MPIQVSDDELEAPEEAPQFPEQAPLSPNYVAWTRAPHHLPDSCHGKDEEASRTDKEEQEEKHLASADFTTLLVVDPVPSTKDTEAFEIDESTPTSPSPRLRRARISVRPQTPMSAATKALMLRFPSMLTAPLGILEHDFNGELSSPPTHHPSEILLPPLFEVGESSSAGAARQTGHTLAHRVNYGFIKIVDASIRAFESRAMTAVGEVNKRVTNLATTQRERRYFRSMASSYEREASDARPAWRQRIRDKDKLTSHIQHEHDRFRELVRTAKAGPQDGPVDKIPPKKTVATTTPMTDAAIKALIAQGVATTLVEYEANRGSGNGDDSHDSGSSRRTEQAARDNCTVACQIKFATCTLLGNALTWWNSYVKTVGHDAAYGMPWKTLKKMMTDKYCPRGEIKKLEIELMFPEESNEVEKYVGGLSDMIQGSVMTSKPKTMQDAIEFATEL
ncbi:hypothetical protein Tco_1028861, partial [Tanacetum coccineum]